MKPPNKFQQYCKKQLKTFKNVPEASLLVSKAQKLIEDVSNLIDETFTMLPVISLPEELNEIIFEWRHNGKSLSVYVEKDKNEYAKIWREEDILHVDENIINSSFDLHKLLIWLKT